MLQLDRNGPTPLQDQLFDQLRQLIISGRLAPHSRVVATRFLAQRAGVSRTTVLLAYERLIAEGYLETRPAVGTFVSPSPPDGPRRIRARNAGADIVRQAGLRPAHVSLALARRLFAEPGDIDFRPAADEGALFTSSRDGFAEVRKALARWRDNVGQTEAAIGIAALRRDLADYLALTRGIQAAPDQIIIVSGSGEVRNLVAHLFQRKGDRVVLEAGGARDAVRFFRAREAHLVHVPVDHDGLMIDCLPSGPASLVCVSPTRQNPLGAIMPKTRRSALIAWARQAGAYILEDDNGIEPHYQGILPLPIAAIDPYGLTFYTGSLAHVFGVCVNIGYLVVPPEFVESTQAMKLASNAGCSFMEQVAAAEILSDGSYEKHLRRLRKTCMARRDALIEALKTFFGEVRLMGTESGTQLTWLLPEYLPSAESVSEVAAMQGIHVESVAYDSSVTGRSPFHDRALVFSYATLTPIQLQQGIARLAEAVRL